MLELILKEIVYNYKLKNQVIIGVILGGIVLFIMVFLQPFGTYRFESNHKYFIFSGFGLIITISYLFCARIENLWYNYKNKRWEIRFEVISFLGFVIISTLPIHFYNQIFLNNLFGHEFQFYEYLKHGIWFFGHSIVPIMLILLPFYMYFRNKFGVLHTIKPLNEIELYGLNRGEKLLVQKENILFVKASENYVKIFYVNNNTIKHKVFRNTLTAIKKQAPFLYKSHRSYLVNLSAIKSIKGNSQNAKIEFHHKDLGIPLSKSYYKSVKLNLEI